ncbi:MAG: lytic transglycosylase F, partial [Deltaproteobacteria bacterium]|nr:lytic transglycosylase F [Deltaproteobacteria bacterium]
MGKRKFTALTICFFALAVIFCIMNATESPAIESVLKLDQKWTGDFDEMVEKHRIRALVPYSKTFYFLDGYHQRGLTYETLKEFETYLNDQLGTKTLKFQVVVIPTKRDRLLPDLLAGLGDIAAGNLTITSERQKLVDFSDPGYTGVDEIIVTGPASPPVKTLDDLSGKEIHVRKSSSYFESLKGLDARLRKEGKKGMKIVPADEYLEDEDLLEMMNAGLIPMVVIDSHKGKFWSQIFKDLNLHQDIKVRTGGQIGWAIRKESPKLKKVVNDFMKTRKKGTLVGNILFKRYLENTKWVRNSLNDEEMRRFNETVKLFQTYANQYNFDWIMIAALAYQESRIDQSMRSP